MEIVVICQFRFFEARGLTTVQVPEKYLLPSRIIFQLKIFSFSKIFGKRYKEHTQSDF